MIKKGFTILELIVSLALFLIIILLSGSIFVTAQNIYHNTSSQNELLQNSRVCIDRMSREIRQSAKLITDISSTTPSASIVFQDGHDLSRITYITYYLSGDDLMRKHNAYYYTTDPSNYVNIDSVDMFGQPPTEIILEDRIVGEYFDNIEFLNDEGLLDISLNLAKSNNNLDINSKIFIRNW